MKLLFVLFIILGTCSRLKGQQKVDEFHNIRLRLAFPSLYNSYNKSCCKLYPGGCYLLLDSLGFTCDLLRGRVSKTESDGWIEFQISNVQFGDGGYYRCFVVGTQNIYTDYLVEVYDRSGHHSQSQPSLTTTIKAPESSTILLNSTGPAVAQDHSDTPRVPWSFGLPLVVIVSITGMILITSIIGVVFYRVRAKSKQSDKYGETPRESLRQEASETGGIVYTTVDFRAHQKQTEVYANLRAHQTPDPDCGAKHDGMVEYSTLAIHQFV